MTVSRDEAEGLLSKWATDSNMLMVLFMAGGMAVSFKGFISALHSDGLLIEYIDSSAKIVSMTIGLSMASEFVYQDIREAPKQIARDLGGKFISLLVIKSGDAACTIYEYDAGVKPSF